MLAPFALHDVSDFPLIRATELERAPGSGPHWQRELSVLVARGQAFVILYPALYEDPLPAPDPIRERQLGEDRKARASWLKSYRGDLAQVCKGLITVEPDARRRAVEVARFFAMEKIFGVPLKVVASWPDAEALGQRLLTAG